MTENIFQKTVSADDFGTGNLPIGDDESRINDAEEISIERVEAVYRYDNSQN